MADTMSALYEQIDHAETTWEVLGIQSYFVTKAELRDIYRSLALRLHPDKARDEGLRERHTQLFQRIQSAYEVCLLEITHGKDSIPESEPAALPESWESLHARNVANKEALKAARAEALKAVQSERDAKARCEARYKAKGEVIARNKDARKAEKEEHARESRVPKERRECNLKGTRTYAEVLSDACNKKKARDPVRFATCQEVHDETEGQEQDAPRRTERKGDNPFDDVQAVTKDEMASRLNQSLMCGGGRRTVCVALSSLEERENCAAKRLVMRQQRLIDAGESEYAAFVQAEAEAEEETDRELEKMERQGIEGIWWDYEDDGSLSPYQLSLFDFIPAGLLEYCGE
ncbi:hypothetical protein AC578_4886 [Pseudocercospora eumusae]|uniref:J domain-containing protein n=1 Tax=Pseudocercospora eumusae TaxID=321146 RepID=A0A139GWW9_9PEZI|nr:hypothetical protein AC578_4886 [Pseudocercospora eumusae]